MGLWRVFRSIGLALAGRFRVGRESSGDWQITAKVDEAAKTKVFNVKLEARKTAHDGLYPAA